MSGLRWHLLTAFGLGYLGDRTATLIRGLFDLRPSPHLGAADPILWMTICSIVIGFAVRLVHAPSRRSARS
ncbi:MAG: hypothetical protein R3F05_02065 [Planctomycetota bacterium]